MMVALWLLSMVVLVNAYIGTYTANLAVPKLESTVDTLEDLAASIKFKLIVELNSDLSLKVLVKIIFLYIYEIDISFYETDFNYRTPTLDNIKF